MLAMTASASDRRRLRKREFIALRGAKCVDCGYDRCIQALDFHHRDPSTKHFDLGTFSGGRDRAFAELEKCDLLCAVCHRLRHFREDATRHAHAVVRFRRRQKERAVEHMGSSCRTCGRLGPAAIFEFHHLDPAEKSFGITVDGVPRRWSTVVAELAKCVMLCANCHREVHAGVREIKDTRGLAEAAAAYAV